MVKIVPGVNDLATVHPEIAAEWHSTKNDDLRPTDVSFGSGKKVWWLGKCGHEWQASVISRCKGRSCPFCANQRILPGFNDLATLRPDVVKEWHPTKNGDLTPYNVSSKSNRRIWWICDKGHEWKVSVGQRVNSNGCPYCSGARTLAGFNDLKTTNPALAAEWHPTKNGDLKPDMLAAGSLKKVWWLGKCGHEWQSIVAGRNHGVGCPVCNSEKHTSFAEQALYYYIHKAFQDALSRDVSMGRELDIFIPSLCIGIEYDGLRYHQNTERDIKKRNHFKNHNVRLINIREKGCPDVFDGDVIVRDNDSDQALNDCIKTLLNMLGKSSDDVDVVSDRAIILSNYVLAAKKNSLAVKNPELAAEWHPTKNNGLTPDQFSFSSGRKVWWLGPCGHEWDATIAHRNAGEGCPYCSSPPKRILVGFNDLMTTYPDIAKEWHPTKNGYLKPTDVSAGNNRKIWWRGNCGHEYQAVIADRTCSGTGCPYCSGLLVMPGINDLLTLNPQLAAEWHPTKNGDLKPTDVKTGSEKNVWWKCRNGHEWQATVYHRNRGDGCPYCSNKRVLVGFNDIVTLRPELVSDWHPVRNGNKLPENYTVGSKKKVWWLCHVCGYEWQAYIANRSKGAGCPVCARKEVSKRFSTPKIEDSLQNKNPKLVAEWHPTKNGDLTPDMVYPGSSKKVWWQCKNGHEWQAFIKNRNKGVGCPYCSGRRVLKGFNDLGTVNPDLAKQWHPTKNTDLTPSDVTSGSDKIVWWLCDAGHEWKSTVSNRSYGFGCPVCAGRKPRKYD